MPTLQRPIKRVAVISHPIGDMFNANLNEFLESIQTTQDVVSGPDVDFELRELYGDKNGEASVVFTGVVRWTVMHVSGSDGEPTPIRVGDDASE